MRQYVSKIRRQLRHGQKGVTLIELLIVVAIMAIIAAVVIPNVITFRTTGALAAANDEASNVKTAAIAHYAREQGWPDTCDDLTGDFLAGETKATYVFDGTGMIVLERNGQQTDPGDWGDVIEWDEDGQKWVRSS